MLIFTCFLNNYFIFSEKYDLHFAQSVLPDNYSIVLQQNCPIYIIRVKQNAVMSKYNIL